MEEALQGHMLLHGRPLGGLVQQLPQLPAQVHHGALRLAVGCLQAGVGAPQQVHLGLSCCNGPCQGLQRKILDDWLC